VTNGIHTPTWDSAAADELWTKTCGKDRWQQPAETLEKAMRGLSDEDLWEFRTSASQCFIDYVRDRLSRQMAVSGDSREAIEMAKGIFDPNTLTLGFSQLIRDRTSCCPTPNGCSGC